jgi:hypothetical protein
MHGEHRQPSFQGGGWLRSRNGLALLVFLGVAAFYLVTEHTAHLLVALPFLLFLLCPLMHLFMHGGHGGHAGTSQRPDGGER